MNTTKTNKTSRIGSLLRNIGGGLVTLGCVWFLLELVIHVAKTIAAAC